MLLLGAHCIDNGGIHMSARRAGRAGMGALQIFTAIPKYYNEKISIRPERVERFRDALASANIAPEHVIVHAGYVLNVATPEPDKWERASAALAKELQRSSALGVGGVCFHPGSSTTGDKGESIERVALAMLRALENTDGATRLLVENTAGAGNTIGRTAAEVAAILNGIPAAFRKRAGYGLDTCHLFASGFEITRSRDHFTEILDDFQRETGEPPAFFHLNDSEGDLGSNRDRHALVGEGKIGSDAFGWLLHDPRAQGVPLILETPQANPDIGEDDDSPDPDDVKSLQLLRNLA